MDGVGAGAGMGAGVLLLPCLNPHHLFQHLHPWMAWRQIFVEAYYQGLQRRCWMVLGPRAVDERCLVSSEDADAQCASCVHTVLHHNFLELFEKSLRNTKKCQKIEIHIYVYFWVKFHLKTQGVQRCARCEARCAQCAAHRASASPGPILMYVRQGTPVEGLCLQM